MKPADFQRLALALEGAEAGSHMGVTDFRVGGRIFATLAHAKQGYGNLLLSPQVQQQFLAESPQLFRPVAGGWGRMGATHIVLALADEAVLAGALRTAWQLRREKNRGKTSASRTRPRTAKPSRRFAEE